MANAIAWRSESGNVDVVLTSQGFYPRCIVPHCPWVSPEVYASKFRAIDAAKAHEEDR